MKKFNSLPWEVSIILLAVIIVLVRLWIVEVQPHINRTKFQWSGAYITNEAGDTVGIVQDSIIFIIKNQDHDL